MVTRLPATLPAISASAISLKRRLRWSCACGTVAIAVSSSDSEATRITCELRLVIPRCDTWSREHQRGQQEQIEYQQQSARCAAGLGAQFLGLHQPGSQARLPEQPHEADHDT